MKNSFPSEIRGASGRLDFILSVAMIKKAKRFIKPKIIRMEKK